MKNIDDTKFDELLVKALYRATELDCEDLPSNDELVKTMQPSYRFRRRMRALINNPNRYIANINRTILFKTMRAAAAAFIIFTVFLGSAMVVSPTVRAAVIDFVRSWFSDRTEYFVPEQEIDYTFTFGYIPEGFELIGEQENEAMIMRAFQRDDSSFITITISSSKQIVNNEHSDFYQTTINGRTAEVYESNNPEYPNILVIHDDLTGYLITIISDIEISELLKIAANIR